MALFEGWFKSAENSFGRLRIINSMGQMAITEQFIDFSKTNLSLKKLKLKFSAVAQPENLKIK